MVPDTLPVGTTLGRIAAARPWLAALPTLIVQVRERFGVRLGPPWHAGSCSWVAPAELSDGTPAVVKIGWPHREMYGEPVALRHWAGRGAVELLAHDPDRHALLLQRGMPGTALGAMHTPAGQRLRPAGVLRERLALLAGELDLPPERIVAWGLARRVESALWSAAHGDVPGGAADLARARILAGL
ncbi:aminoglycoside phosphotransferase family protein [Krasilnikovia sp. M28-CT-15]|uniref:aminoglycoside phosphotransferase family protein n=1 Tax=Krasilnikovia sp. M28-CT-15 TaxID=3373540 RepID=UPI00399CA724